MSKIAALYFSILDIEIWYFVDVWGIIVFDVGMVGVYKTVDGVFGGWEYFVVDFSKAEKKKTS